MSDVGGQRDDRAFALFAALGVALAALLARGLLSSWNSPYVQAGLPGPAVGGLAPASLLAEAFALPLRGWVAWPRLGKLPAFAFEPLLALAVWLLVRRAAPPRRAALAAAAALLAPTTLLNGALIGWADAAWASFALLCVWALAGGRSRSAAAAFAAALALGPPALALAPTLVLAALRRGFDRGASYVAAAILVPVVAVTAALAGSWGTALALIFPFTRDPPDAPLSGVAASIYMFVTPAQPSVVGPFALAALALAVVVLLRLAARDRRPMSAELVCLTAYVFVALAAFGLPRAGARFAFAADLLAIALAGINPAWVALAAAQQLVSLLAVLPSATGPAELGALASVLNLVVLPWAVARWLALADPDGAGARLPGFGDRLPLRAMALATATFAAWSFALQLLAAFGGDAASLWPAKRTEFAGFVAFLAANAALAPAGLALERRLRARLVPPPAN